MAEVVTHTFSASNALVQDLKKKIKTVEQEMAIITSTVKDLFVSFPLIGQKEKERKQFESSNMCINTLERLDPQITT